MNQLTEEKKPDQETAESEELKEETTQQTEETAAEETESTAEADNGSAPEEEPAEDQKASGKKERDLGWTKKAKEKARKAEEEKTAALIAEANDKYARLFAEFDNFRKRSEKEKSMMFSMGAKDVIERILPVVDSFERGLASVPEEQREDPFVVGMDKVYKQFEQTLADMGVKPIEAVGKEFDPDYHNAVMHVDDDSVGENIVVEEFQKGYMYKDTVVRFSMVKVAN